MTEIVEDGRIYPNEFDDEIAKLEDFKVLMADVLLHPMFTEGKSLNLQSFRFLPTEIYKQYLTS